jgi:hypothetical protein
MGQAGKLGRRVVNTAGAGTAGTAGLAYFGWPVLLCGGVMILFVVAWFSWILSVDDA